VFLWFYLLGVCKKDSFLWFLTYVLINVYFGRYRNKYICFLWVGKINYFIKYSLFVDRLLEE
jgi:hypothetical protein